MTTLRQALEVQRAALPPGHPDLAETLLGLGEASLAQGRPGAAESAIREALEIQRNAYPADSWRQEHARALLGATLCARGSLDQGTGLLEPARTALAQVPGRGHPASREVERLARLCQQPPDGK